MSHESITGSTLTILSVILQYDPKARLIVVDVKKAKGERKTDLTHMAYYMEKDVCCSFILRVCILQFHTRF